MLQVLNNLLFFNANSLDKNELRAELSRRKDEVDKQKALDRSEATVTRDTFQEAVCKYMLERNTNEPLQLKNLVQSDLRNKLKTVQTAAELREVLEGVAEKSAKVEGWLNKLDINEIDLANVPSLSSTMLQRDVEQILKVDERIAADILKQLDTSSVIGHIEDYDPSLFEQLQGVDEIVVPTFDSYYYKTKAYKTPASLGLLVYAVQKYLLVRGYADNIQVGVDTSKNVPTIRMNGTMEKVFEIPVENGDQIDFEEATMAVPLLIDLCVFKDPESENNIITFTNGNVQTMAEFLNIENDLTTSKEYSLLASILCQNPEVTGDSELYTNTAVYDESHAMDEVDEELNALATEEQIEEN